MVKPTIKAAAPNRRRKPLRRSAGKRPTSDAAATKSSGGPQSARRSAAKHETKQQRLIAMLRRPEGATIAQMAKTFGWQPHTVRGVISATLKKRLGLSVASEKSDSGRIYRLA